MNNEAQMRGRFAFLNICNIRYEPMGALIWADTDKGTMRLADLRGWGHLTGHGQAWGLDAETARKVQDAIGHVLASSFAAHQAATDRIAELEQEVNAARQAEAEADAERVALAAALAGALAMLRVIKHRDARWHCDEVQTILNQGDQALATTEQQEKK